MTSRAVSRQPARVSEAGRCGPTVRDGQAIRDSAISALTYVQDNESRSPTCFRTNDRLYVYGGDEWENELYDTVSDPAEERNIIETHMAEARILHERYIAFLKEIECPELSLKLRKEFPAKKRDNLPYRKII